RVVPSSSAREGTNTSAPALASASENARPRPPLPPVTMARFPSRENSAVLKSVMSMSGLPGEGIGDAHVGGLKVLVDALEAAFAPDAGLLHAAERSRRVGHHTGVQTEHAGLQILGQAQAAVEVAGVGEADQAELCGVGQADRLV